MKFGMSSYRTHILIASLCIVIAFTFSVPLTAFAGENVNGTKKVAGIKLSATSSITWYNNHIAGQPYIISTNSDMEGLVDLVNYIGVDFSNKDVIKLDNDLLNLTIPPIGTTTNPFSGTFDGNGKKLNNLNITVPESMTHIGLFGKTAANSVIKNLQLSGTITVSETDTNGKQIRYVGAIAGYALGNIENCDSSMDIKVTSKKTLGSNDMGIIRNIGGLAGYITGNMKDCTHSGDVYITSPSNINEDVRYLIGEIGGLSGAQGNISDPNTLPKTENCVNTGDFIFNVTGQGGLDRFGAQLYAVSFAVGGIIGQASGVIENCINKGCINSSNGTAEKPEEGFGANNTGGIVGSLRGVSFDTAVKTAAASGVNASQDDPAFDWYKKNGGADNPGTSTPSISGIYGCSNTGDVIGLAAVGGIIGTAGSFTEVEGSSNTGNVKGCRWNKPFAAGIAGNTAGNVRFCFNRGDVYSVTGGGYYCSGLVGGLWSVNTAATADKDRVPTTELTGCYSTGTIYTSAAGYRTAFLAGENQAYIHDNVYSVTSPDNKIVDTDAGTTVNNYEVTRNELTYRTDASNNVIGTGGKGRGLLNTYASGRGNWEWIFLPDTTHVNAGYPVLSKGDFSVTGAGPIPTGTATRTGDAVYSAANEPAPQAEITLTPSGEKLVQNADFRIVAEPGALDTTLGADGEVATRPYTAQIVGMGLYAGNFGTISYGIGKASIADCTIVCETTIFNWERQFPDGKKKVGDPPGQRTKLIDAAGQTVDPSEYTVSDLYDTNPKGKGSTEGTNIAPPGEVTDIHYYDYTNAHGPNYKYDVKVTAKSSSTHYKGEAVQQAFRIKWALMIAQLLPTDEHYDPSKPESVVYGDVTWQGQKWDLIKAMRDTSGNTIKITYTGKPVTPTVTSAKYLGRELRESKGTEYVFNPFDYDYKYIYGNPNPEASNLVSTIPTDVTLNEPSCMTIRFTAGGNFDNYVNVFFRIVPADIGNANVSIPVQNYSGSTITPLPSVVWNGNTLVKDKDYVISGLTHTSNVNVGTATAKFTITGKGNFNGSKAMEIKYDITARSLKAEEIRTVISDRVYTGKALTIKPSVQLGSSILTEETHYSISKATYENNVTVGLATAKFTIKGKGYYINEISKVVTFKILPTKTALSKLTAGKKTLKIKFNKVAAGQKVTSYQVQYRVKGTAKWKTASVNASKNTLNVKKLKKGKVYEVQVRAVKTIKSGAAKGTYNGAWSAIKQSKKIK